MEGTSHVIDGRKLGNAHTCHHAGCADGTGTDADFHGVCTVLDQHAGGIAGGDITDHDVNARETGLCLAEFFNDRFGMTVGSVNHDGICAGSNQCFHAFQSVPCPPDAGSHSESSLGVFASHGFVFGFGDVLIGDESDESSFLVHDGKFLDFVLLKDLCGGVEVCLRGGDHEGFAGHHLVNSLVGSDFKAEVAVGDDAHEVHVVIHDGDASDVVFVHHFQGIAHGFVAFDGHGVINHAVFRTFHDSDLTRLFFNAHVLVNHTDATFTCNGNCHRRFGHGVHGCSHEGNLQVNVA